MHWLSLRYIESYCKPGNSEWVLGSLKRFTSGITILVNMYLSSPILLSNLLFGKTDQKRLLKVTDAFTLAGIPKTYISNLLNQTPLLAQHYSQIFKSLRYVNNLVLVFVYMNN